MVLQVSSPNLWTSPYSDYQSKLFNIIKTKHEVEQLNFQEVCDYLISKGYRSPRNKDLTQSHVWSIYKKKVRSIERFSKRNETEVLSTRVDVINYVPD